MTAVILVTQSEGAGAQEIAAAVQDSFESQQVDAELWFLYRKTGAYDNRPNTFWLSEHRPVTLTGFTRLFFKLVRQLRRKRPVALITFTHYANVLGSLAAIIAGVPVRVVSQQNPPASYPRVAKLMDLILGSLGAYVFNVCCSKSVFQSFEQYPASYRRRLLMVRNGANVSFPTNGHSRLKGSKPSFIPPEAVMALSVGRLAPQKNHATTLSAIASLTNVHLVILGDGELRETLAHQARTLNIATRVHFAGELPREQVRDLMAAADIYLMPSLFEGLSLALIEAMGAGLPIVASRVTAMEQAVMSPSGPVAVLVDPNSAQELKAAIEQIISNETFARELSDRAREHSKQFDISKTAAEYLRIATDATLLQKP
jgi:glycosyltransferase involved in cell wall biosynthesis